MEFPVSFKTQDEKLVIIEREFIGIDLTQQEVDLYLERLEADEKSQLETTNGKIVYYANVDEVVSEKEKMVIEITVKTKEGYSFETISLMSLEERDNFVELIRKQLGSNFSYNIQTQKLFDAILLPGAAFLASIIGGGFITWFSYLAQEPLQRARVMKAYVYYIYQICKFIGPTVAGVISGSLALISLYFVIRKSVNRPIVILMEKVKS